MPLLGSIGAIYEADRNREELTVWWKIPNFLDLPAEGDDFYDSPYFDFSDVRWRLRLYPKGRNKNPPSGYVCLFLQREHEGPPVPIQFTLCIKGAEEVGKRIDGEHHFTEKDASWCSEFLPRHVLSDHQSILMPDSLLTFTCSMKCAVPSPARIILDLGELPSGVFTIYSYRELEEATRNFNEGYKVGGGMEGVYRAEIRGDVVAVKRFLPDQYPKIAQFLTELKILIKFKHENLLQLLGCCVSSRICCLVYEFMPNGCLQDRLSVHKYWPVSTWYKGSDILKWQTRLSIAYGIALGINYLHTFGEKPMIHRDIKSENILLDRNFVPKVGDFGLVRTECSGESPFDCTRVYKPKEAFSGEVSVKWDTYSFGIVLLELITGQSAEKLIDLKENREEILSRLDTRAEWDEEAATELYGIARRCFEETESSILHISEILEDLRKLSLPRQEE